MDLFPLIACEVGDILDARDMDHTMVNRFAILTELQAVRFDVFVYSNEYLDVLTRAIIGTALDIHELV
jgi:hypothetical protein